VTPEDFILMHKVPLTVLYLMLNLNLEHTA